MLGFEPGKPRWKEWNVENLAQLTFTSKCLMKVIDEIIFWYIKRLTLEPELWSSRFVSYQGLFSASSSSSYHEKSFSKTWHWFEGSEQCSSSSVPAAQIANVPLMVHHTNSGIPLDSTPTGSLACPGSLRPGRRLLYAPHRLFTMLVTLWGAR